MLQKIFIEGHDLLVDVAADMEPNFSSDLRAIAESLKRISVDFTGIDNLHIPEEKVLDAKLQLSSAALLFRLLSGEVRTTPHCTDSLGLDTVHFREKTDECRTMAEKFKKAMNGL